MFTTATTNRPVVVITDSPVRGTELVEAAHAGIVRFYKMRENGSMRQWPVLEPGSNARKQATKWQAGVEAKSSIAAIAKESHTSPATVRRALTALAFTEEIENLPAKDKAATAKAAVVKKEEKKPAPAKKTPAKKTPAKKPASKKVVQPGEQAAKAKEIAEQTKAQAK